MQRVLRIMNRKQEQSTWEHQKHQDYKQLRNRKKKGERNGSRIVSLMKQK